MDLDHILKLSYKDKNKQKNEMAKQGYNYDSMLSNNNNATYYNPTSNKLMFSVAGTHSLSDWGTDLWLGAGHLKDTNRYKDSKKLLDQAKKKYNTNATISGHSLGGTIAGYIGDRNDKVYTVDKGATIGQKMRSNEHAYRSAGDVVSLLNAGSKHMTTLANPNGGLLSNVVKSSVIGSTNPVLGVANFAKNVIQAHDIDNIQKDRIRV